jgi:Glycosyl transferases group 1
MRVAQILLPGASAYERKSQRLDAAALSASLVPTPEEADIAHVYGPRELPPLPLKIPFLASGIVKKPRFALRKPRQPDYAVAPVADDTFTLLPEPVDERFFALRHVQKNAPQRVLGSIAREPLTNIVQQTMARIGRFRNDVAWHVFNHDPEPEELLNVDAWIDPAIADDDFDGYTAEALVIGLPVIASRTPINVQRCEQGRTGLLVPPNDANELVHAILAALFKPEVAEAKIAAARQTASKFRVRQRLRVLEEMYRNLTP